MFKDNPFMSFDAAEPDTFTTGDFVQLLTGSPDMTVLDVCECGNIDVAMYDDISGMQFFKLPAEALIDV